MYIQCRTHIEFLLIGAATPPDLERAATPPDLEGADPLSHPDYFGVKEMTNIQELFEARVHLGHKMGVWNPIMKPYLYGTRADIHIFDLDQTLRHLRLALNVTGRWILVLSSVWRVHVQYA